MRSGSRIISTALNLFLSIKRKKRKEEWNNEVEFGGEGRGVRKGRKEEEGKEGSEKGNTG